LKKKFEKIRIVLREKKENEKASRKNPTTAFERKRIGLSVFDKGSIQRSLKAKKKIPKK